MKNAHTFPMVAGTYVQFEVDGVLCEGVAEHVLPAGGVVPPGWRVASTYVGPADDDRALQYTSVFISREDYQRIVEAGRLKDTPAARQEALRAHVRRLAAEETLRVVLRRRGLKGHLPREFVQHTMATPHQWKKFESGEGDISIEELVRAGCLPDFGADGFLEWAFCPRDAFDEAWAEELEREKAKATAPYRRYLEEPVSPS